LWRNNDDQTRSQHIEAEAAGWSYEQLVNRILEEALAREGLA
jgi:hypothetical protein